jgi:NAD(P)-dependent dehydrogenase (short-subunit alcohol dehydrogenase family)
MLTGKEIHMATALITGASRGLGLALARQLARDGWTLILDARGAATLKEIHDELSKIATVYTVAGDVTNETHRTQLVEVAKTVGGLDAVVNNASTLGLSPQPSLLDYPLNVLEDIYRTNVIAPLALLQTLRPHLKEGARIINVTSDAGVEPYEGWGGYGSSKAALEHATAILAAENLLLKVYWVDPGDMRTQMHQEAFPNEDISDRPLPEESVPGFVTLLTGNYASGRYKARDLNPKSEGVQELRISLTVSDFDASRSLYQDGLRLPVALEWDNDDGRGVVLSAGRATIEIVDNKQADTIDRVEVGKRVAGPVRLAVQISDLEATAKALEQHGATVIHEAVQTPWGDRNQRLQATDDMQITLFEITETEPVNS